jgi:hypothetical protein
MATLKMSYTSIIIMGLTCYFMYKSKVSTLKKTIVRILKEDNVTCGWSFMQCKISLYKGQPDNSHPTTILFILCIIIFMIHYKGKDFINTKMLGVKQFCN